MTDSLQNNGDLELDSAGYELGTHMFQSFLLAGERHVVSGLSRSGTDERRFAELYAELPADTQDSLAGYFRRQSRLSLSQRAKVLGPLIDLDITDHLKLTTTARTRVMQPSMRTSLAPLLNPMLSFAHPAPTAVAAARPAAPASKTRLHLCLDQIKVEEAQDDYYIWFPFVGKKVFNKTDEVTLGVISVDATGGVKKQSHNLGSIKEGKKKSYDAKKIASFSLSESGDHFPRVYSCNVTAIERDDGGYNDFLRKAADYAKKKITKELIAAGIEAGSALFGAPLNPALALLIANAVKGYVDKLIDWLANLLKNNDDILGNKVRRATLNSFTGKWNDSGTYETKPWDWVFSGAGGRWRTRLHWELA